VDSLAVISTIKAVVRVSSFPSFLNSVEFCVWVSESPELSAQRVPPLQSLCPRTGNDEQLLKLETKRVEFGVRSGSSFCLTFLLCSLEGNSLTSFCLATNTYGGGGGFKFKWLPICWGLRIEAGTYKWWLFLNIIVQATLSASGRDQAHLCSFLLRIPRTRIRPF
jgi:hypothetical protein